MLTLTKQIPRLIASTTPTNLIRKRLLHMSGLQIDSFTNWSAELSKDPAFEVASTVLKNFNADDALLNKSRVLAQDNRVFNYKLSTDVTPVTNQRSSGRCWLFAATNELRIPVIKEFNLKDFEISQAYLFFYDKLEKANYFLDQIIDTKDEHVESRLVQNLLTSPTNDGGQYSMFLNIVAKYGLIPKDLYKDLPFSTTSSNKWNSILTTKLREMAQTLRETSEDKIPEVREGMQKEIFKLMTLFMDLPPVKPNEKFVWTYEDKDKKFQKLECTPLEFASQYCKLDLEKKPVSLVNDPRNPYGKLLKIDRLGNVIGGDAVVYLNVDNKTMNQLVKERIIKDKAVFFGSHTPKYMDKKLGIMDTKLWNYDAIGYTLKQDKANRLRYNESLMTHAMLIKAVHVPEGEETPVRYLVENSWGKDSGKDGLYVMTREYFEEYCFQIVVDLEDLPSELASKFEDKKEEPILLPLWDPMGALAN